MQMFAQKIYYLIDFAGIILILIILFHKAYGHLIDDIANLNF